MAGISGKNNNVISAFKVIRSWGEPRLAPKSGARTGRKDPPYENRVGWGTRRLLPVIRRVQTQGPPRFRSGQALDSGERFASESLSSARDDKIRKRGAAPSQTDLEVAPDQSLGAPAGN